MTVSELIAELQKYGGNEQVGIWRTHNYGEDAEALTRQDLERHDARTFYSTAFTEQFPHGAVTIR